MQKSSSETYGTFRKHFVGEIKKMDSKLMVAKDMNQDMGEFSFEVVRLVYKSIEFLSTLYKPKGAIKVLEDMTMRLKKELEPPVSVSKLSL